MIVDRNRLQQGDGTERHRALDPLARQVRGVRLGGAEVDGHDHARSCWRPSAGAVRAGRAELRDRPHAQGPGRVVHARTGSSGTTRCPTPSSSRRRWRSSSDGDRDRHGACRLYDCRDAFSTAADRAGARQDERIVAVVNDSVGSSKLGRISASSFPDRLINVGIAEQNMVGVGAGLANGGRIPFVSRGRRFLTGRALEQIKADVAYSNANVKLVRHSSGMAYGELGPTHHSIEDLAWLRAIANLPVIVPADPVETAQAVRWAARAPTGPVFIRISRMPRARSSTTPATGSSSARRARLRDGGDVTIIAYGVDGDARAGRGRPARRRRGRRRACSTWRRCARWTARRSWPRRARPARIVTVEEHTVHGGLGGAVAEVVVADRARADAHARRARRLRADRLGRVAARALRADRRRDRRRGAGARRAGLRHDRARSWRSTRARPTPRRCSSTPADIVRRASRPVPTIRQLDDPARRIREFAVRRRPAASATSVLSGRQAADRC